MDEEVGKADQLNTAEEGEKHRSDYWQGVRRESEQEKHKADWERNERENTDSKRAIEHNETDYNR